MIMCELMLRLCLSEDHTGRGPTITSRYPLFGTAANCDEGRPDRVDRYVGIDLVLVGRWRAESIGAMLGR